MANTGRPPGIHSNGMGATTAYASDVACVQALRIPAYPRHAVPTCTGTATWRVWKRIRQQLHFIFKMDNVFIFIEIHHVASGDSLVKSGELHRSYSGSLVLVVGSRSKGDHQHSPSPPWSSSVGLNLAGCLAGNQHSIWHLGYPLRKSTQLRSEVPRVL
jgi:hypothetical protein